MFDTEKNTSTNSAAENGLNDSDKELNDSVLCDERPSSQVGTVDYKDLFLRLNADFQNFKKRVEKQKAEWLLVGEEAVILKLLPVLQDLERALNVNVVSANEKPEAWTEGLRVVHKNLLKALTELDVQEIAVSGAFNPEFHEAIAQVEAPTCSSGQIVDTVSKGYLFKGKVVKYAQVTVAK